MIGATSSAFLVIFASPLVGLTWFFDMMLSTGAGLFKLISLPAWLYLSDTKDQNLAKPVTTSGGM